MKKLGQNFINDEMLMERIVDYADLVDTDLVFEVGTGPGVLTRLISEKCKVVSMEYDYQLYDKVLEKTRGVENISLICADALKYDWPDANKMISAIPYAISKELLKKLVFSDISQAVWVVQKEFAEKISADTGGHNYRMISALTQTAFNVEIIEYVSASSFEPIPPVDSAVVILNRKRSVDSEYYAFLNNVFNQKNKKLRNVIDYEGEFKDVKVVDLSPRELYSIFSNP